MAGSRNRLGRGLSALIPSQEETPERREYFACRVDRIRPMRDQPRQSFDDAPLRELAASIERSGVLQPVLVRSDGRDYVLIAGERRWRAARLAGLEEMPVIVKDVADSDAFTLALVENLQREDLGDLEKADACQRLIDDYGMTQQAVADAIGMSRSAVANILRLRTLSDAAKDALVSEVISAGHARQMVGLEPDAQLALLDEIERDGLSVRQTEARVRERKSTDDVTSDDTPSPRASRPRTPVDPELRHVAEQLESALGTRVRLSDRGDGRGEIRIDFHSYAILEGILERILDGP